VGSSAVCAKAAEAVVKQAIKAAAAKQSGMAWEEDGRGSPVLLVDVMGDLRLSTFVESFGDSTFEFGE
ncbi:MAG: hypothetical protein WAK26_03870, partial [Terracidiphilus sp.]